MTEQRKQQIPTSRTRFSYVRRTNLAFPKPERLCWTQQPQRQHFVQMRPQFGKARGLFLEKPLIQRQWHLTCVVHSTKTMFLNGNAENKIDATASKQEILQEDVTTYPPSGRRQRAARGSHVLNFTSWQNPIPMNFD